jgi:hypothetical protein
MDGDAALREYAVRPKRCSLATHGAQYFIGGCERVEASSNRPFACMACAVCCV